jgi:hypothetical protein
MWIVEIQFEVGFGINSHFIREIMNGTIHYTFFVLFLKNKNRWKTIIVINFLRNFMQILKNFVFACFMEETQRTKRKKITTASV